MYTFNINEQPVGTKWPQDFFHICISFSLMQTLKKMLVFLILLYVLHVTYIKIGKHTTNVHYTHACI